MKKNLANGVSITQKKRLPKENFSMDQVKQLHRQVGDKPKWGVGYGGGFSMSYVR